MCGWCSWFFEYWGFNVSFSWYEWLLLGSRDIDFMVSLKFMLRV